MNRNKQEIIGQREELDQRFAEALQNVRRILRNPAPSDEVGFDQALQASQR